MILPTSAPAAASFIQLMSADPSIFFAASSVAPIAWLASMLPMLIRRTPSSANSVSETSGMKTDKTLTGLLTESTTRFTWSTLVRPGAYRTLAPAASKAGSRLIVLSRSLTPRSKFSARAVNVKGNESLETASAQAVRTPAGRPQAPPLRPANRGRNADSAWGSAARLLWGP